jgi:hypothetical protein
VKLGDNSGVNATRQPIRMLLRRSLALLPPIIAAGCAPAASPLYFYEKPGTATEQVLRDEAECQEQSMSSKTSSGTSASFDQRLVDRCMASRGYAVTNILLRAPRPPEVQTP